VANKKGHYKLSPRLAADISPDSSIGISPKVYVQGKNLVSKSDLLTTRGVCTEYTEGNPNQLPSSTQGEWGVYSLNASEGEGFTQIPTQNIEIPIGEIALVELFPSSKRADAEQRIRDCGQRTIHLTGLSDAEMVGSGADVDASGDDPHWPARSPAA
jgi:hypothetical protein